MRRRTLLLAVLGASLVAAIVLIVDRSPEPGAEPAQQLPPAVAEPSRQAAGRQPPEPDSEWIETALAILGNDAIDDRCGSYRLLTDVPRPRWEPLCTNLVEHVEQTYAERLGVRPVSSPLGAIVVFAQRSDFTDFAERHTGLAAGYAAFSRPSRGIVAVVLVDSADTLAATLAHELAHLLHRRTFGTDLPPWLSEGLADAVGDTATAKGFRELEGITGAGAAARRLVTALDRAEERPLHELLSLRRDRFDRGIRSFDYEQSALLVRFLLLDADSSDAFRSFLGRLAAGSRYSPEELETSLGKTLPELQAEFRRWLRAAIESA